MRPLLASLLSLTLAACAGPPFWSPDDGRRGGFRLNNKAGLGPLFLSGSGDEPPHLIQRFRDLAGGQAARITIGPFAGGSDGGTEAVDAFRKAGVADVTLLRNDVGNADMAAIARADGIYFVGGFAEPAARNVEPYRAALQAAWRAGAAIGGHSAGAMVWGERLIARGEARAAINKGVGREGGIELVAGLGFLPGAIVDPHFGERGRFPRLWVAAGVSGALGIGIDEDTAAVWRSDGRLTAVGLGAVTLIRHEGGRGDETARVTVLSDGRSLDLTEWGVAKPE